MDEDVDALRSARRAQQVRQGRLAPPPTMRPVDELSLVEVLQELDRRGIDYAGCLDKTLLIQKLAADMRAEEVEGGDERSLVERYSAGQVPQPSDLLLVGNAHQRRQMEGAMARAEALGMEDPEPEPEWCTGAGGDSLERLPVVESGGVQLVDASVMGQAVWPSALVLAEHLPAVLERASPPPSMWSVPLDRPLALEIGAGCAPLGPASARPPVSHLCARARVCLSCPRRPPPTAHFS
jgi:hypothetical protein